MRNLSIQEISITAGGIAGVEFDDPDFPVEEFNGNRRSRGATFSRFLVVK
jgi:hypothetical protein